MTQKFGIYRLVEKQSWDLAKMYQIKCRQKDLNKS